ncbi:MAG TPA: phosphohydrolase [Lachnospiraceae bacterium]|nr:HD domain-containing protein [uncultured Lachnoclostridium sp.]HAU87917.1 phosphohydrolase [Lachnospiraceae bacterium]
MQRTETLIKEMITYYSGDPKRIQHFIKVHSFAKTIGLLEKLDKQTLYILETAALVHDIGIKLCEQKYGECNGKLQELEGPAVARGLLEDLGYDEDVIERVCFLVAHHHTYDKVDNMDYQILIEADFLVNMYEEKLDKKPIELAFQRIFKTPSGRFLCKQMFDL